MTQATSSGEDVDFDKVLSDIADKASRPHFQQEWRRMIRKDPLYFPRATRQ